MKKGTRVYYQKLGILLLLLQISIPIVKSVFDQKNKTLWVSNKKQLTRCHLHIKYKPPPEL